VLLSPTHLEALTYNAMAAARRPSDVHPMAGDGAPNRHIKKGG
jgi:hypothetical protein